MNCLNNEVEENKEHIIAKWLEGSVTDTELNVQHDTAMSEDLRMICEATADLEIPTLDSEVLFQKIKADIAPTSNNLGSKSKIFYLKYWVSGIAAILIGILAYTTLMNQNVIVDNNTLTYLLHNLPDGSSVHLNADSQLEYDKDFVSSRNITLEGEAFFEVKKGEKFTVHTSNGDITVLGTSFNVFSRNDNLSVACKTGKVKVSTQSDNILNPGDKIIYVKNLLLEAGHVNLDQIDSWRTGESIFQSSPLSEVLEALTAQYGYTLKDSQLDLSQRFTGSFIHDDIEKALRMVFLPMGISYTLDTKSKIILIQ